MNADTINNGSLISNFYRQEVVEEGGCKCAVFSRQISKPIIERALLYNVTCDSEGQEKCQQLCVALVSK